ncbi:MAG: OmpA family protein [Bacillota bacterium]
MRRGRRRDDRTQVASWLTTYGDLVTLLLTFFVFLFAFSTIDARKFRETALSLQGALGVLDGGKSLRTDPYIDPEEGSLYQEEGEAEEDLEDRKQLEELREKLEQHIRDKGLEAVVVSATEERGIILRFSDNVLFDLGSADLKPEARRILSDLADLIREIPNHVRVEGHTDNLPIHTEKFPSNWELSTGRASTVVRYFVEEHGLAPERLSVAGYGEYRPLVDNSTEANRRLNRRVDIVLLRLGLSKWEPGGVVP